jgi:dTDP-4-dehydrorhamnose reductase
MLGRAVAAEWRGRSAAVLALSRAQADVRRADDLAGWARNFRPEVVINCAAFTRVDDCEREHEIAFAVNGEGAGHAAAAATESGARFLHVSTDYVFDGTAREPYGEDAATAPLSAYGKSKLDGERRVLALPGTCVVRSSWLFGHGGANFARTICDQIARRRDGAEGSAGAPLRVVADQVGCPTYTRFLARALWDLAQLRVEGVVHYRNREAVSWHGFAMAIAESKGAVVEILPVTSAEFLRPAPRPCYSVLNVARFESLVQRPVESWSCGLREYLDSLAMEE